MGIKNKHIAIICNYELLESRVGGMDYFFWAFNKQCEANQIKVDWFFPNTASHGNYHEFHIIPSGNKSIEQHFIDYLNASHIQYTHIITHFVELCTSFFAEVKKCQNAKVITVDHNPRPLKGYPLKKRLKKRLKGWLYAKHIDVFVGVSEYTSQAILNDFGDFLKPKAQTIYNGILIDNITPKTTERRKLHPRFLVVSHLRASKGIQDLIEAVNLLDDDLKSVLIIDIYGDGPYKNDLLLLVAKHKLEGNFNFKGSHSNVKELYHKFDYLLHPSHEETFCFSVIEAMAANIVPVTTNEGGNVLKIIEHNKNGFLFNAKNTKDLSELLLELIKGKQNIVGNTRALIEKRFSIDTMVENHMKLLDL